MKTYLECIPCFMKQALNAGRIAVEQEYLIKEILNRVGEEIRDLPLGNTPPETGGLIYKIVSDVTGIKDPYQEIKLTNIAHAFELYPEYLQEVKNITDPKAQFELALRIATAGNVIDLGVSREFDLKRDINEAINSSFKIWDFDQLYDLAMSARSILYIGDNSGETVFDLILLQQFNCQVYFATRGVPVLNDVTETEAKKIGIDQYAKIVSSGVSTPGAVLKHCNKEFINLVNSADLVIAKGQGNYEALSDANRDVFFLLKAKCPVIARDVGVEVEDFILSRSKKRYSE